MCGDHSGLSGHVQLAPAVQHRSSGGCLGKDGWRKAQSLHGMEQPPYVSQGSRVQLEVVTNITLAKESTRRNTFSSPALYLHSCT
jgi:hypothetical protein